MIGGDRPEVEKGRGQQVSKLINNGTTRNKNNPISTEQLNAKKPENLINNPTKGLVSVRQPVLESFGRANGWGSSRN